MGWAALQPTIVKDETYRLELMINLESADFTHRFDPSCILKVHLTDKIDQRSVYIIDKEGIIVWQWKGVSLDFFEISLPYQGEPWREDVWKAYKQNRPERLNAWAGAIAQGWQVQCGWRIAS